MRKTQLELYLEAMRIASLKLRQQLVFANNKESPETKGERYIDITKELAEKKIILN